MIISVGTFVDRVTPLRDGDEESQRAAKLLARRGLNESVLMEARSLLAQLGNTVPEAPPPDLEARCNETRAAEAELWSWYLEWSQIARGVITDRRLLRELGLRDGGRDGTTEDEAEPDEDAGDDAGIAGRHAGRSAGKAETLRHRLDVMAGRAELIRARHCN